MTNFPNGIFATPNIGGGNLSDIFAGATPNVTGNIFFVDGDNGADGNDGLSPQNSKATIQSAVTAATDGGVVYVKARNMVAGASDPVSYAEHVTIPATHSRLSIIGVGNGRTQMGLPQIKPAGTVAGSCIDVKAVGCLIANIGFNGISTAGAPLHVGVLLNSDGATGTYRADGAAILNCHFKNCTGSTATDCRTGGAITWSANGDCWQVLIKGNDFYKNACDVCLLGTSNSVPQDVIIEDNVFSGPTANVDTNLWLAGGSGMNGVTIRNNVFPAIGTLGSAVVKRFIDATGCVGLLEGNSFGTSTTLTFGAAGSGAKIPTTMFMPRNYRETTTGVSSEVFRT